MSISQLVNEISDGSIVLPAIQRDFVWDEDRIVKLFDSLFRGYPVGIVMLWETYQPLQYRSFVSDHVADNLAKYKDNDTGKRIRVVLDGQQRLSSLFVALKGTYEGKGLYFDVLSGREGDDYSENKFGFLFTTEKEAGSRNASRNADNQDGAGGTHHWVSLSKIVGRNPLEMVQLRNSISNELQLSEMDKVRLEINFHTANYILSENSELLKTQVIDSNLPADDHKRKTAFDILEIFVRINRQGLPLQRSDLIISLLRLYWNDASRILPSFIKEINQGNNFILDNDFVIRCMFATSDLGTRLDFELLRKRANVEKIRDVCDHCFTAIRSAIDFVRAQCHVDSSRLIGGPSTLIPLVYFIFKTQGSLVRKESIWSARQSLFLFAFTKVFTQHVDSRTGAFIRSYLSDQSKILGGKFPIDSAIYYAAWKTGFREPNSALFANNKELALALLQRQAGGKVLHSGNLPEVDHIFPRVFLEEKGVDVQEINSLGNLWILPQTLNRNKSAIEPRKFLEEVDGDFLKAALIDFDALDGRMFRRFIRERENAITRKLVVITGLNADQFACLNEEKVEEEEEP